MNRSRKVWINRPQSIRRAMKNTIKHSEEGACSCYDLSSKRGGADPLLMVPHFPFLRRKVPSSRSLLHTLVTGFSQAGLVAAVQHLDKRN